MTRGHWRSGYWRYATLRCAFAPLSTAALTRPGARGPPQIRVHLAKEFVEDLKWVKARLGVHAHRLHTLHTVLSTHVPSCPVLTLRFPPQEENADMLREALSCSLKLPTMDMTDVDDDGRPLR